MRTEASRETLGARSGDDRLNFSSGCAERQTGTLRETHVTRHAVVRRVSHTRPPCLRNVEPPRGQRSPITTNLIDTHLLWPSNKNGSRCTSHTPHIRVHPTLQSHWRPAPRLGCRSGGTPVRHTHAAAALSTLPTAVRGPPISIVAAATDDRWYDGHTIERHLGRPRVEIYRTRGDSILDSIHARLALIDSAAATAAPPRGGCRNHFWSVLFEFACK